MSGPNPPGACFARAIKSLILFIRAMRAENLPAVLVISQPGGIMRELAEALSQGNILGR